MSSLASLIILCAIGIAALLVVSVANRRQAHAKRARQRLNILKLRVDAIEELALILDQLVDNRSIVKLVYDEALAMLEAMRKLDPDASYVTAISAHAQQRAVQFADLYGQRAIFRLKESDAQIARSQRALAEAARILRQQQSRKQISADEFDNYLQELTWLQLYVETISLIGRGMAAMVRGDVMGAFALYKRAQANLLQSDHVNTKRGRFVKELNEMLGKRRDYPSEELMPEAQAIYRELSELNKDQPAAAERAELGSS